MVSETFSLIVFIGETFIGGILGALVLEYLKERFNISNQEARLYFIGLFGVSIIALILMQAALEFGVPPVPTSILNPSQLFAFVSTAASVIALTASVIALILTYFSKRSWSRTLEKLVKPEKIPKDTIICKYYIS